MTAAIRDLNYVSVIMPLYNEERYIEGTLDSLLAQNYPAHQVEIICIDGGSIDRTAAILAQYAASNERIKLLKSPNKKTAVSLNIGIKAAQGHYIVRVDGHSIYPHEYLSTLIAEHHALGAANVGTVCYTKSLTKTIVGRAASFVLSCPFGVGNSRFRIGVKTTTEVDTVPFGCFKRDIFYEIGDFDERLHRTEDYEFNQRLRRHGGRIFLLPAPGLIFYTRDQLGELLIKQFGNGYGIAETALLFKLSASIAYRHFVPLFFVLYLAALPAAILFNELALFPLGLYIAMDIYFAARASRSEASLAVGALVFALFPLIHATYGLGSLKGFVYSLKMRLNARKTTPKLIK